MQSIPLPVLTGGMLPGKTKKHRPAEFKWIMLTILGLNLAGRFLPHKPTHVRPVMWWFEFIVFALFEVTIYWNFWKGRNWARIWMMVGCAFSIAVLGLWARYAALTRYYVVLEAVMSCFLFYWLTRKPVVAFFKAPGEATSNSWEAPVEAPSRPLGMSS